MKKLIVAFSCVAAAAAVWAGPHGCPGGGCRPCGPCGPGWGPRPCGPGWGHHPPPPPHGGWGWGRGGCNFWPGFVGGVVGSIACSAVASPCYRETVVVQQPTTVVTQPMVVQQQPVVVQQPVVQTVVTQPATRVWVEGRYVDQVQANGSVIRTWQPGHYE